jgi:hypothetical protein
MKLINIRMPDDEVAAIRAMADAECLTLSAFVRRVLRQRAEELALLPNKVQLLKIRGTVHVGVPPVPELTPSGALFVEAEPDFGDLTNHE